VCIIQDPQYLRSDLIGVYREFFYITEERRVGTNAYDNFAVHRLAPDSTIITLNYDVALERALARLSHACALFSHAGGRLSVVDAI